MIQFFLLPLCYGLAILEAHLFSNQSQRKLVIKNNSISHEGRMIAELNQSDLHLKDVAHLLLFRRSQKIFYQNPPDSLTVEEYDVLLLGGSLSAECALNKLDAIKGSFFMLKIGRPSMISEANAGRVKAVLKSLLKLIIFALLVQYLIVILSGVINPVKWDYVFTLKVPDKKFMSIHSDEVLGKDMMALIGVPVEALMQDREYIDGFVRLFLTEYKRDGYSVSFPDAIIAPYDGFPMDGAREINCQEFLQG